MEKNTEKQKQRAGQAARNPDPAAGEQDMQTELDLSEPAEWDRQITSGITSEQVSAAEAVLFASGDPLPTERVALALELPPEKARKILRRLGEDYAMQKRGIRLVHVEDTWQLCSAPEFSSPIRRAIEIRRPAKLSQPALEVLTIVAYYQPVTRLYIEQLRGMDSSYTVSLLVNRQLIETCGHLQAPGRPLLYRTTSQFLRTFHLNRLEDLPDLPETSPEPAEATETATGAAAAADRAAGAGH